MATLNCQQHIEMRSEQARGLQFPAVMLQDLLPYALVAGGILPKDYPVSAFAVSGYSGGGKKLIAQYQAEDRGNEFNSARLYALSQSHKHLKEMKAISGLERTPLFSPMVTDYYSGMTVSLSFYADMLNGKQTPQTVRDYLAKHYEGEKFITVQPLGAEEETGGILFSNGRSGWDGLEIYVTGNEERIMVTTRFDNLGKGASGAAIQCLNIVLGCEEDKGLVL